MQNKSWCVAAIFALSIFQNLAFFRVFATTPSYYTAAVFEYVQTQNCTSDPEEAQEVLRFNLEMYIPAAKLARSKGADILVFPEYALFPECNRTETTLFCEKTPDPKEKANPCVEVERFKDSPTLRTLSCLARNNSMVIQANVGEYLPCEGEEPACHPSGNLQYNANVVFDRDGTLISRYRKEHLWYEPHFDLPFEKQCPIFTVDFGTFLSYVCFDIFLERIIETIKEDVIDGIVFSTMWENTMPLGMTVEFFEAFTIMMNTTLMAACIQLPGQWAVGSGIFSGPYGALAYTFDPDGINKLVVARVPRRDHVLEEPESSITAIFFNGTTSEWKSDGVYVPEEGSDIILPPARNSSHNRYHVINMENYTLHQITLPHSYMEECNNGMCCSLEYSADAITETYYFAVFNGTQDTFYPYYWGEEDCLLVRCDAAHGRECATFPLWTNDIFHHVNITANFSTPFVYPTVVNDHFRLVPYKDWNYNTEYTLRGHQSNINFDSEKGQPLLVAGLKGRLYREDPESSFF
ncbi:pantetheinase-like [Argiope bruennichi]|uniref:Biotinidase like protein n=1 Tax=Argiope bruennichi TaxID=94029 RepID=A0A8T0FCQ3_ARGBR|nr:pantetheinase-like [Argiope bruennichi]KAF8788038.1 Biotinidase like protein [Argiope bruennichi]